MATVEQQRMRAAENQALFRRLNERMLGLNEDFAVFDLSGEWVCECAAIGCIERLTMPLDDFELLRTNPNRFAVIPGHELGGVERVVEEHEGYLIVEKLGAGGERAKELDPRGTHSDADSVSD